MTKQTSKKSKLTTKTIDKTKALKWVTIGFGIAVLAVWILWFTYDCIFVSKGITIELDSIPVFDKGYIRWHWTQSLYNIQQNIAFVFLGVSGAYMGLLFSYMVICGLNIRSNLKANIYQLIISAASIITIAICLIMAGKMMINQKYVIDMIVQIDTTDPTAIQILQASFNVYHLDFLKWFCIIPAAAIFSGLILVGTFRKNKQHALIKDSNLLILVYAILTVGLFGPFVELFGFNDPAAQGLDIIQGSITWRHVAAQCTTTPIGVFAGMIMVLMVIRLVVVIFTYNNRWHEKKAHLIIFSIIGFLVFAGFIVSHVNPLDFEKLVLDYQSMKIGGLVVVLVEVFTCLLAGTYCLISHINYQKRAA